MEKVVEHLRDQGEPSHIEAVTEDENGVSGGNGGGSGDDLYDMAVALVCREDKASTSFVQRHLQIGYNRTTRIIERMEAEGVVGKPNHVGKREVLFRPRNPASEEQEYRGAAESPLQVYNQADRLIERMEFEDVGDRPSYMGKSEVGAAPKQVRGFWGRLWSR